jgi:hypothetical protein
MFKLTRTSAAPASPLRIKVSKPEGDDAGLTAGGSYVIAPGDTIQVDAYVAGLIMDDVTLAPHFDCLPPWKPAGAVTEPVQEEPISAETVPSPAPDAEPERRAGHSRLTARGGKITRDDGSPAL